MKLISLILNVQELWLVYNDQGTNILDGSFGSFGHAKGVVAANKDGGFWLVHSVPHFPPVENEYSYPKTGLRNGQSMLCISILKDQLDILGKLSENHALFSIFFN